MQLEAKWITSSILYAQIKKDSSLKKLDRDFQYPDGLYNGRITVQRKISGKISKKPLQTLLGKKRSIRFRMYHQKNSSLYFFFDPPNRLVNKILYLEKGKKILVWDPLRGILHKKEGKGRFCCVLGSGFHFVELVESSYELSYRKDRVAKDDGLLVPKIRLKSIVSSPFPRISLLFQTQSDLLNMNRPQVIDSYDAKDILRRSLYIFYETPVYNRSSRKEEVLSFPSLYKVVDLEQKTISVLEIQEYDLRAVMKSSLFDPLLINR